RSSSGVQLAVLGLLEVGQDAAVLRAERADDAAAGRLGEQFDGARAGRAEHVAHLQAAVGADHHLRGPGGEGAVGGPELAEEAHGAVAEDVLGGHGGPLPVWVWGGGLPHGAAPAPTAPL